MTQLLALQLMEAQERAAVLDDQLYDAVIRILGFDPDHPHYGDLACPVSTGVDPADWDGLSLEIIYDSMAKDPPDYTADQHAALLGLGVDVLCLHIRGVFGPRRRYLAPKAAEFCEAHHS